jgi:hypothetical protein
MPSFIGFDRALSFPEDGPRGRFGLSLEKTLCCRADTPDGQRCVDYQLTLSDQRRLLLALIEIDHRQNNGDDEWQKIVDEVCELYIYICKLVVSAE